MWEVMPHNLRSVHETKNNSMWSDNFIGQMNSSIFCVWKSTKSLEPNLFHMVVQGQLFTTYSDFVLNNMIACHVLQFK